MNWRPGSPVLTNQDRAEWLTWRKERKREAQRQRRARYPRIDYYPDRQAADLIYGMSGQFAGGDLSSVINRIVTEWADDRGKLPPE